MVTESELVVIFKTLGVDKTDQALKKVNVALDKTVKSSNKLAAQNKKTTTSTEKFRESLKKTSQSVALLQGPLGPVAGRITALNQILTSGTLAAAGFAVSMTLLATAFGKSALAAGRFETQMLTIEAVLKTTGGVSGQTIESIDELTKDIGINTLTSVAEVRKAAAQLLTFKSIAGDAFGTTLRLAQDLAALGFTNLTGATQQLAKALEDPATGLAALRRSGIIFNESQKQTIKLLAETGQKAEAQRIILEKLSKEIGGTAVAAAKGLSGAFDTLGDRITILFEELGKSGPLEIVTKAINSLADSVKQLIENLPELIENFKIFGTVLISIAGILILPKIFGLIKAIITIGASITLLNLRFRGTSAAIKVFLGRASLGQKAILALAAPIGLIVKLLNTLRLRFLLAFGPVGVGLAVLGGIILAFKKINDLTDQNLIQKNKLNKQVEKTLKTSKDLVKTIKEQIKLEKELTKQTKFTRAIKINELFRRNKELEEQIKIQIETIQKQTGLGKLAEFFGGTTPAEREFARLRELQDEIQSKINFFIDSLVERVPEAAKDAAEGIDIFTRQVADSFETLGKGIRSSFQDFFFDIFNEGKLSFKNLFSSIRVGFAKLAADLVAQKLFQGVIGGLLGFGVPGGALAKGLAGGAFEGTAKGDSFSLASGISSLLSATKALLTGGSAFAKISIEAGALAADFAEGLGVVNAVGIEQAVAQGIKASGTLAGIGGGFAGNFAANALFGDRGIGATIGGTVGSVAGPIIAAAILNTVLGVPGIILSAFGGSFIGNFIGGLFGADQKRLAATFGGLIVPGGGVLTEDPGGFERLGFRDVGLGTEFPEQLVENLIPIFAQLNQLGVNLAGIEISGGIEATLDKGAFFGFGESVKSAFFEGFRFDPGDEAAASQAFTDFILELSKRAAEAGQVIDQNIITALQNIQTEGKTVDDILSGIQFAAAFDDLFKIQPRFTEFEIAIENFNSIFDLAIDKTIEYGLSVEDLTERFNLAIKVVKTEFKSDIRRRILRNKDPVAASLQDLQDEFLERRRTAIKLGTGLILVEELFNQERLKIVQEGREAELQILTEAFERTIRDIERIEDSLRLDTILSGTNRLGRSIEAQSQLDELGQRIVDGDATALEELNNLGNLLGIISDFTGPTAAFFDAQDQVFQILDDAKILAANTFTIEEQILNKNSEQVDLLSQIFETLSSTLLEARQLSRTEPFSQFAGIEGLITGLDKSIVLALKDLASGGLFTGGGTGLPGTTFAEFVKAGNEAAGREFLRLLESLVGKSEIAAQAARFGFESFAHGGTARGLALVGEEGPELVNFGQPTQIFSNRQSMDILGQQGNETTAEIRGLREDFDVLLQALVGATKDTTAAVVDLKDDMGLVVSGQ